jgi:hypothetical protein
MTKIQDEFDSIVAWTPAEVFSWLAAICAGGAILSYIYNVPYQEKVDDYTEEIRHLGSIEVPQGKELKFRLVLESPLDDRAESELQIKTKTGCVLHRYPCGGRSAFCLSMRVNVPPNDRIGFHLETVACAKVISFELELH